MTLQLFNVSKGIEIESEDFSATSNILFGTGTPGGDADVQDSAPIGSIYLRDDAETNELNMYYKFTTGNNSLADWHVSASQTYVDAIATGLSWREPALVRDNTAYATIAEAEAAANVGDTVDGVGIAVDDRILYTNLGGVDTIAAQDETNFTGGTPNGSFVGGTGYANGEVLTMSDGSTITVDLQAAGVITEFTITTSSTAPFLSGSTLTTVSSTVAGNDDFTLTTDTNNEAGIAVNNNVYIVSGGTGAWTLTEDTNLATDGDALLIQEGSVADTQWVYDGTDWVLFSSSGNAAELGYIRDFIGKNAAGAETPVYTSSDVITQNTNLEAAIGELDGAMGDGEMTNDGTTWSLSDDMAWATAGTLTITAALDELNEAIGSRSYTEDNYVTDGQTITASIDALDQAVPIPTIFTANVTTLQSVDTILTSECEWAKWFVAIEDVTNTNRRRSFEVDAITDGTTTDHNEFAKLRFGGNIAGLVIDVVVAATNTIAAQDETDYTGGSPNGSFVGGDGAGGTAHVVSDILTMSDGSTITVDAIDGNDDITQFTVTTASTIPFESGATLVQVSSTGSGDSFTMTTDTNNEAAGSAGLQLQIASTSGVDVAVSRMACDTFN